MSTLFGILSTGRNGMIAHQVASNTSSHNATNAATQGHTRRMVQIESIQGPPEPGMGSRAKGSRRILDPFLERRILGARTGQGKASAQANALSIFDFVLADSEGDIGASLDRFTEAFADLSNNPGDLTARRQILERGDALANSFRRVSTQLNDARIEINERIEYEVLQVNERLHQIADLGKEIAKYELDGREAGDLRDARDERVREIAERIPVTAFEETDGTLTLLFDGSRSLVSPNGDVHELSTIIDLGTGDIGVQYESAGVIVDLDIQTGSLGGFLAARDGALSTAIDDLDQLAFDVATAYNNVHQTGFGLDGLGGRDLFFSSGSVANAASSFGLDAGVSGNLDAIAAAQDPAMIPGDNRVALEMMRVVDQNVALGSSATAIEAYAEFVGQAATSLQQAMIQEDTANASLSQVEVLRESISGVSVDEEMVDLMQFQRGYQASLKIIQTADEMLAELMTLKR